MFAKLLVIIVAAGTTASALLVNRQQRLETAHRAAALHADLAAAREKLWDARAEIAERLAPDRLRQAMDEIDDTWAPITAGAPGPGAE